MVGRVMSVSSCKIRIARSGYRLLQRVGWHSSSWSQGVKAWRKSNVLSISKLWKPRSVIPRIHSASIAARNIMSVYDFDELSNIQLKLVHRLERRHSSRSQDVKHRPIDRTWRG